MARIQKIKQVLTENLLPDTAPFGTVFVCKDTQTVWYASRSLDGTDYGPVVNLTHVLESVPAFAPVRHGKDGVDGATGPKAEKGDAGLSGRDGAPGVAGPPGSVGPVGPAGPRGERGEAGPAGRDGLTGPAGTKGSVGPAGPRGEIGPQGHPGISAVEVLAEARAEIAATRAELSSLRLTVQGLLDMNTKASEYIEWLRARAAARKG